MREISAKARPALRRGVIAALCAASAVLAPLPLTAADLYARQPTVRVVPQPARVFVRQDVYEETLVVSPPAAVRGACGRSCGAGLGTRTVRKAKERYWSRATLVEATPVRPVRPAVRSAPAPVLARPAAPPRIPRARPYRSQAKCLFSRCDP